MFFLHSVCIRDVWHAWVYKHGSGYMKTGLMLISIKFSSIGILYFQACRLFCFSRKKIWIQTQYSTLCPLFLKVYSEFIQQFSDFKRCIFEYFFFFLSKRSHHCVCELPLFFLLIIATFINAGIMPTTHKKYSEKVVEGFLCSPKLESYDNAPKARTLLILIYD